MTRHERYFKKIVLLIVIALLLVAGNEIHSYYKERALKIAQTVKTIESYRQKIAVLPALTYMQSLSEEEFWRVWPFLEKSAGHIESPFYYEFAKRFAAKGDVENTLFWLYLGRFSITYDALRCEDRKTAVEWKLWFDTLLSFDLSDIMIEGQREALNADALKQVLEFDQRRSAQSNPVYMCLYAQQPLIQKRGSTIIPPSHWPEIRTNLRNSAARLINAQKK